MNSYLHIETSLGQERTIELFGEWSPLYCKDKLKKVNNLLNNHSLLSVDQKKEPEMTPALEKAGPVMSTSSKQTPEHPKNKNKKVPEEKTRRGKERQNGTDLVHRDTGLPNGNLQPWTVCVIL
ncbi:hypothetical protein O181_110713 [Austropuccinia psidii MF-1]|uniref:Uncharacterized protein n=1 Tax=Austropuccinia psidii MF-1 TaxID=1389203 RepID=A0A9Q3JX72_9BASI|nr:hypothetical protein [Austropuccinia psidii MF-1]